MHPHTKFGIASSNVIRDRLRIQAILLKTRSGQGYGHGDPKIACDTWATITHHGAVNLSRTQYKRTGH